MKRQKKALRTERTSFRVGVFGGRSCPVAASAYGGLATGYFLAGFQPAIRYAGVELMIPYPGFQPAIRFAGVERVIPYPTSRLRYGTRALSL